MAIIKIGNPAIDLDAAEIPNLSANKITSDTLADARVPDLNTSKITAGTLSDARLPANALNSNVSVPNQSAFKNIIINGDMSLAQRATSVTGITGAGYETLDRFRLGGAVPGTWTWSQETDVPTGSGFAKSMKLDCTTTEAAGSMYFQHKLEGQNLQYLKKGTSSAESTTLSFWVKSAKTGTYIAMLLDNDNTRHISKSYTISSANTWEKKTITYAGDTTGAFGNDNGASLEIYFWLSADSNNSSGTLATSWASKINANNAVGQVNLADSTSNDFYITGIQLEAGTTASDFEFLPYDVNLQRCQRYCYSETAGDGNHAYCNGFWGNTTRLIAIKELPVSMRTAPSLTTTGNYQVNGTSNVTITSFALSDNNINDINAIQIRADVSSGGTAGQGGMIRNGNDATATFILSSEL